MVDQIHVVALRPWSEHLLEVLVNFDMQVAHNVRDEPLVFLRVTRPEQRILDEERLEALYFVLLRRIDQFDAKFGWHVLEKRVFESLLSRVDELLC